MTSPTAHKAPAAAASIGSPAKVAASPVQRRPKDTAALRLLSPGWSAP